MGLGISKQNRSSMAKPQRISPRRRRRERRRTPPGTAPGTIQVDPNALPTSLRLMAFNDRQIAESELSSPQELNKFLGKWSTIWIDVTGLGNGETIRAIGELLGLHPLALEDVVNVHQRAKLDTYEGYLFAVARMVDSVDSMQTEQISFFVRHGLIISFQERPGDCWNPVRNRLRQGSSKIRSFGSDYLFYALLDAIVDSYFPIIESISDDVDALDAAITQGSAHHQMHSIHELRGHLLTLRRAIRPHREMLNELIRDDHPMISPDSMLFFRDCYDHVTQLIDLVDTYREMTSDVRDFYLSSISNRMNEIMKVLTIMSTIFIPLSFIAGVYGMNFDTRFPLNMPELNWWFGYPFALGLMTITAAGLLFYFRRRGWL